ncbi:glutamine amidotransferase-related protein [Photobacterium sp. TY1-4]|uniref:glutamine amidotransferase-related protein n=1 Tax=Photobacterium sp. TY1-4 TaxID=2899122 RepID=UPI0021C0F967|nr:gamma-glutamyl-gamma-aminobutyrate hydrolase family protein [Photobacterium sp. TY1-4]UXI04337.1 gamma-glutamyl-gamma-aminobutyrate hydrolase family protein [Photobacterium sp. TY1-4]
MKIGILQCDDVTAELQPQHNNYPAMFKSLLHQQDETLELVFYRALDGELPQDVDECDVYMTTGSRHSVNDPFPWIDDLLGFIRELHQQQKKLVGICFGHQLIAKALGGEVIQAPQGWGVGVATHEMRQTPDWLNEGTTVPETLSLVVSHQDQVAKLPEHTQVLAGSTFCPNAMIQVGQHLLGIQGHPEFSKAYSKDLMHFRQHLLPPQVLDDGLTSLAKPVDSERVTGWILDFLRA